MKWEGRIFMKSSWSATMELVTMSMGVGIMSLGVFYLFGFVILQPVLVTGISIAGFCLTLGDAIIKIDDKNNPFVNTETKKTLFIVVLYTSAIYGFIIFPNFDFVQGIKKEDLEFISTVVSVITLGFVILAIGYNNRKEVIRDIDEQFQLLKENQKNIDELKKKIPGLEKELLETQRQLLDSKNEVERLQVILDGKENPQSNENSPT